MEPLNLVDDQCADSLASVKKLVFKEKRSMKALKAALA
jgi:hypothetical protein